MSIGGEPKDKIEWRVPRNVHRRRAEGQNRVESAAKCPSEASRRTKSSGECREMSIGSEPKDKIEWRVPRNVHRKRAEGQNRVEKAAKCPSEASRRGQNRVRTSKMSFGFETAISKSRVPPPQTEQPAPCLPF